MTYMSRMGLWGQGTAFADFDAFLESMRKRGVVRMCGGCVEKGGKVWECVAGRR